MGVCLGDVEQRHIERLRIELAEAIILHFAYPHFFDFATRRPVTRPVDKAKRDEIELYVRSINFEPVQRIDLTSPEIRRFIARLFHRYLDVNSTLHRSRVERRLPELRSRGLRVASEIQRSFLAYLSGNTTAAFGVRRPTRSWAGTRPTIRIDPTEAQRRLQVLEAALIRHSTGTLPAYPASPPKPPHVHVTPAAAPRQSGALETDERGWRRSNYADATVPVPAQSFTPNSPNVSPFSGLEIGAQSAVFESVTSLADVLTGPLTSARIEVVAAVPAPSTPSKTPSAPGEPGRPGAGGPRELPSDLYQLYGDYLRDMHPEVEDETDDPPTMALPAVASPSSPRDGHAASHPFGAAELEPPAFLTDGPPHVNPAPPITPGSFIAGPQSGFLDRASTAHSGELADMRSDKLIFWQLRYQLEAYVRRAARSYGVPADGGDPAAVLDALRRSGFVDESDLRIAEGILALTDRVTATTTVTMGDYRQALMLYLLYHRSHLG